MSKAWGYQQVWEMLRAMCFGRVIWQNFMGKMIQSVRQMGMRKRGTGEKGCAKNECCKKTKN